MIVSQKNIPEHVSLAFASPFSSHMVLQRDLPVPVWGWSAPNETITVSIAGRSASGQADDTGAWSVNLEPLTAGGPHVLTVESERETVGLEDVLVGEVWICSGQSNMQMHRNDMPGSEAMLRAASGKPLRSMEVPRRARFQPQERCEGGWSAEPAESAVAFAFQYHLQERLGIPVGVIVTSWGSSFIEGWMPMDMTEQLPHFKTLVETLEQKDHVRVADIIRETDENDSWEDWASEDNIFVRTRPNLLYNAMIHPLIPFAARGVVWYQGEANAENLDDIHQYGKSLPLWCRRMRSAWKRDDLHFMIVMLPGYSEPWEYFREKQLQLPTQIAHASVVNTIDLGGESIHPVDKAPIGERLALLAGRDVYGQDILAQGPLFSGMTTRGNELCVTFNHAEGLTTVDDLPPTSFQLSGADGKWYLADARIEGDSVILTASEVCAPVHARYAFFGRPNVNLVNSAGLPTQPFRTDPDPNCC